MEVLKDVPAIDQASELELNKCIFPVTKTLTLGVLWTAREEVLTHHVQRIKENSKDIRRA